jgi:hypothetical protein
LPAFPVGRGFFGLPAGISSIISAGSFGAPPSLPRIIRRIGTSANGSSSRNRFTMYRWYVSFR